MGVEPYLLSSTIVGVLANALCAVFALIAVRDIPQLTKSSPKLNSPETNSMEGSSTAGADVLNAMALDIKDGMEFMNFSPSRPPSALALHAMEKPQS